MPAGDGLPYAPMVSRREDIPVLALALSGVRSFLLTNLLGDGPLPLPPPVPTHDGLADAPAPATARPTRSLRDDGRKVQRLAPAPRGALLAAADALGRVLLVDAAAATLLRIWKVRAVRGCERAPGLGPSAVCSTGGQVQHMPRGAP
jgi:hypothetical protein